MTDVEYKTHALKEYNIEIQLIGNDCPRSQSQRHHFEMHPDKFWCNKCGKAVLPNSIEEAYYFSNDFSKPYKSSQTN